VRWVGCVGHVVLVRDPDILPPRCRLRQYLLRLSSGRYRAVMDLAGFSEVKLALRTRYSNRVHLVQVRLLIVSLQLLEALELPRTQIACHLLRIGVLEVAMVHRNEWWFHGCVLLIVVTNQRLLLRTVE
jgi:hypothetical protein